MIRKDREYKVKKLNRYLLRVVEKKYTYEQELEFSRTYFAFQWLQFVRDVKSFFFNPFKYPRLAWALSSFFIFLFLEKKDAVFPLLMGAITEDSKTESATDIATTFNVTVADNEDRMMILGVGHYQGDSGEPTATYNGDSLTVIKHQEGSFEERASLYGLVNPNTGTNSFVVSSAGDWTGFGVLSAYGCAQRLPTNTHGVSNDTSEALTTLVDGSWVIAAIGAEPTITMTTSGGVEVMNEQGQSYQNAEMHYVHKATAGAQTMSYSLSYGARSNMALCELEPATADYPESQLARETDFATSVTSMAVNMPTAVMAGELLIALVSVRNAGTWNTIPTGWTELDAQLGGGSVGELTVFYKIADGTENGTTPTWIASTGTSAAWLVLRITDWHGTTPPELAKTSGDATNANPPTVTASWGSDDNLFIAVASNAATTGGFTAAPTNYTNLQSNGASSGGAEVSVAFAIRKLAAASDDPGTFTPNSNRFWAAMTIVVRPEGAAAPSSDIKKMSGVLQASLKKISSIAEASVKKVSGVAN